VQPAATPPLPPPFPSDPAPPTPLPPPQLALVTSDPSAYALSLAEAVTGAPAVREGYGPAYDALLAAAPPAALTPEGVAKAHKEARGRRAAGGGEAGRGEGSTLLGAPSGGARSSSFLLFTPAPPSPTNPSKTRRPS
jgi:hypothetical protein